MNQLRVGTDSKLTQGPRHLLGDTRLAELHDQHYKLYLAIRYFTLFALRQSSRVRPYARFRFMSRNPQNDVRQSLRGLTR